MKLKKIAAIILAVALVGVLFAGCGSASGVTTDGSTSMEKVIGALGEAFTNDTGIAFSYNPTGSGTGIKAVLAGTCDIGLSSRNLKDEETSEGLEQTVLALDGIAIIVNPENPVEDLADAALCHAGQQLADADIVRADVIERRDHAVQHMVNAGKFPRPLHCDHVLRVGDHADDAVVAALVVTDRADVAIRQILADGAEMHRFFCLGQHGGKLRDLILRQAQEVKRQPLRRLAADAGELCKLLGQPL